MAFSPGLARLGSAGSSAAGLCASLSLICSLSRLTRDDDTIKTDSRVLPRESSGPEISLFLSGGFGCVSAPGLTSVC